MSRWVGCGVSRSTRIVRTPSVHWAYPRMSHRPAKTRLLMRSSLLVGRSGWLPAGTGNQVLTHRWLPDTHCHRLLRHCDGLSPSGGCAGFRLRGRGEEARPRI
jgi:hypothetical protein